MGAEIVHDNIIWIGYISKLGGVESFAYYMAKKYKHLDIAVMCKSGDINQLERIRQYCPAYVHHRRKSEMQNNYNELRYNNS